METILVMVVGVSVQPENKQDLLNVSNRVGPKQIRKQSAIG